jgi:hypothetical protein
MVGLCLFAAGVFTVSQVAGSSAAVPVSHLAMRVSGATVRAARLRTRAEGLVARLERERHSERSRELTARDIAAAKAAADRKAKLPAASAVSACVTRAEGRLKSTGAAGVPVPPHLKVRTGFVSAAEIQAVVKGCLTDPQAADIVVSKGA